MRRFSLAALAAVFLVTTSCPISGYHPYYLNVTHYTIDKKQGVTSPGGVLIVRADINGAAVEADFLYLLDIIVHNFDTCMISNGWPKLRRKWFGVFIPPDWYVSECSGEQLIPSEINYKLCADKGLFLPEECRDVHKPTEQCPCVCNVRSTIQDDFWIVTTPNLKLFTAELARLSTGINNPWSNDKIVPCLHSVAN